jgi:hypothetical protein
MITRLLLLFFVSAMGVEAAVYDKFPGFKSLFDRASFVGIVKLGSRDVRPGRQAHMEDWTGPHRFFHIESQVIFKGPAIKNDVARLADRRLGTWGKSVVSIRNQEILAPDGLFLVFLTGRNDSDSTRYRWDELHAEGSVLPVSPKSNLNSLKHGAETPLEKIATIVQDYTDFCRQLYEQAVIQETLIEQHEQAAKEAAIIKKLSEQGSADQPATAPESKPEGKEKSQPESEVRPQ